MSTRASFDIRQIARRIWIVLGLVAAVNAGFYVLRVRPIVREYAQLLDVHGPEADALAQRQAQVEAREAYLASLRKAEADLSHLRGEVLSTRERRMVEAQLELTELCEQFKIDLESVNYQNEPLEDEELDRFAMIAPLAGGYANLRRFLHAVETSDKFLVVERVQLAQGKEGGVLLQLNITVATYFTLPVDERPIRPQAERERRRT
jgi:hypothetical protein